MGTSCVFFVSDLRHLETNTLGRTPVPPGCTSYRSAQKRFFTSGLRFLSSPLHSGQAMAFGFFVTCDSNSLKQFLAKSICPSMIITVSCFAFFIPLWRISPTPSCFLSSITIISASGETRLTLSTVHPNRDSFIAGIITLCILAPSIVYLLYSSKGLFPYTDYLLCHL